jgi:iron(III) transport system substrate-binding protein
MSNLVWRTLAVAACAMLIAAGGSDKAAAQEAWKAEWDKTVAAAKKEGKIVLYMRRYDGVLKEFAKKYPEITPVIVTGEGGVLGARILAERRADKYLVDIYVGGPYTAASMLIPGNVVDSIPDKLILPEVLDQSKWITGKHRYTDPERKYNFAFLATPGSRQLSYNSNLVDPKKITSYKDLIDPKWKGKIVSIEPNSTFIGAAAQFMYYNPHLGPDYFRAFFGGMDITFARNNRQMTDWLASGKYALCVGCLYVEKANQQGLPVDVLDSSFFAEGASFQAASGSISLINKAPHPNAAKVFLNWLLSREGQIAAQENTDNGIHFNSGRIDIPKDIVDPEYRLTPGKEYFDQNSPDWADIDAVKKLADEVVAANAKAKDK